MIQCLVYVTLGTLDFVTKSISTSYLGHKRYGNSWLILLLARYVPSCDHRYAYLYQLSCTTCGASVFTSNRWTYMSSRKFKYETFNKSLVYITFGKLQDLTMRSKSHLISLNIVFHEQSLNILPLITFGILTLTVSLWLSLSLSPSVSLGVACLSHSISRVDHYSEADPPKQKISLWRSGRMACVCNSLTLSLSHSVLCVSI